MASKDEDNVLVLDIENLRPVPDREFYPTVEITEELRSAAAKAYLCTRTHGAGCRCSYEHILTVVETVFASSII